MTKAPSTSCGRRVTGERGSILIQVAVALLALLAFSAYAFDFGILHSARGQAHNAADAGALAGAQSLLRNQGDAHARATAFAVTGEHRIWGQNVPPAEVTVTVPLACPAPFNTPNGCIRVDISHQNMPTFFARLANVNSQGVRATATAMAGAGNSVDCIRPWVVADKWTDNNTGAAGGTIPNAWDQMDTYDPAVDTYTAPGFRAAGPNNDIGLQLALKEGQTGTWSSGWTMQVEFGVPGSNAYRDAIQGCQPWIPVVGIYDGSVPCSSRGDAPNPPRGCLDVKPGMAQGPTSQGVGPGPNSLISQDPGASWNTGTNTVQGGCMGANTCELSPRVVPVAIFNTTAYHAMATANNCNGGNCRAQVVAIIGFFVEGMCNDVYPNQATRPPFCGTNAEARRVVLGRIMNYPGQWSSEAGNPGPESFIEATFLVR